MLIINQYWKQWLVGKIIPFASDISITPICHLCDGHKATSKPETHLHPKPMEPKTNSSKEHVTGMVYGPNTSIKAKGSLNPPRSVEAVLEQKITVYTRKWTRQGAEHISFRGYGWVFEIKNKQRKKSHSSIAAAYHYMPCELNYIQCPSLIHFIFFLAWY